MVIFAGGKILQKCCKDISPGGYFHDTTPMSFIKANRFYFRVGVIFVKPKARKTRKLSQSENFHVYSQTKWTFLTVFLTSTLYLLHLDQIWEDADTFWGLTKTKLLSWSTAKGNMYNHRCKRKAIFVSWFTKFVKWNFTHLNTNQNWSVFCTTIKVQWFQIENLKLS